MITTLQEFIDRCQNATSDDIYTLFESDCEDSVRDEVYSFADAESVEPFRSAMIFLGFADF